MNCERNIFYNVLWYRISQWKLWLQYFPLTIRVHRLLVNIHIFIQRCNIMYIQNIH